MDAGHRPDLKVLQGGRADALTSPIRARIHSAATQDGLEPEGITELDRLAIQNLINVLSEVALSIARREGRGD